MKAREVIDTAMSDWHSVNAASMAEDTFGQLDAEEIDRLARRAYAEEWRAALRVKDSDGVPRYASIEINGANGERVRVYKQTELFSVDDFHLAIAYHRAEIRAHAKVARALTVRCNEVHGTQLAIDSIEESA